jgi:hypothetical protein
MSTASAIALPLFGPQQHALPWSDPDLWLVPPPASDPLAGTEPAPPALPAPDQLCFGANQIPVWDIEPEPLQPSLLAEPPMWEAAPSRRSSPGQSLPRSGPLPGQLHFFGENGLPTGSGEIQVPAGAGP